MIACRAILVSMKLNQQGTHILAIGSIIVVLMGLGLTGWYVYKKQHAAPAPKAPQSQSATSDDETTDESSEAAQQPTTYDAAKVAQIANFDTASSSLKLALTTTYWEDSKQSCDVANQGLSTAQQNKYVMTIKKMVRDEFAIVAFCGRDDPVILGNRDTVWQELSTLSTIPSCDVVNQFGISREIVSSCYDESGEQVAVTNP